MSTFFRQRYAELEEHFENAQIDESQFAQLGTELKRSLLGDASEHARQKEKNVSKQGRSSVLVIFFLLVPVVSFAVYGKIGAIEDWTITESMRDILVAKQQGADGFAEQSKLIESLESRLQDRPDNVQYLALLGRSYMGRGNYDKAAILYAKIVELLPQDPDARAYYAEALYLARGKKVDADVQRAIDEALKLNPHQLNVLGMVGMAAFESGDYRKAAESWQSIIKQLPTDSSEAKLLADGVRQAKLMLAKRGESFEQESEAEASSTRDSVQKGNGALDEPIKLKVALSLKAGMEVAPDKTVFVFAKAAQGPPLPLAVVKLRAKDLPAKIVLDESQAMAPNMTLAQFSEVVVTARVSKSGGATASSGDLQGQSQVIKLPVSEEIRLVIDQQIQ